MTISSRIRGNAGIVLTLKKSTGTATAFNDDAKEVVISGTDKDDNDLTFTEAMSGEVQNPTVKIKAIQSTDQTSLHQFMLDNLGQTVEMVYGPHGNATPAAGKPHFKVTGLVIANIPDIGGPARRTTEGYEFEVELQGELLTKVTSGA